ncbi:hypothetical protein CLOM_g3008 [Closterium sp. NIES-68]|nr:hypothetical protein CLOM_g3008 [Closterium sp. NIES-68]
MCPRKAGRETMDLFLSPCACHCQVPLSSAPVKWYYHPFRYSCQARFAAAVFALASVSWLFLPVLLVRLCWCNVTKKIWKTVSQVKLQVYLFPHHLPFRWPSGISAEQPASRFLAHAFCGSWVWPFCVLSVFLLPCWCDVRSAGRWRVKGEVLILFGLCVVFLGPGFSVFSVCLKLCCVGVMCEEQLEDRPKGRCTLFFGFCVSFLGLAFQCSAVRFSACSVPVLV